MLRRAVLTLLVSLAALPALSEEVPVPDRRLVAHVGQDFYGGDVGSILGTDFATCSQQCLGDASCRALTFNMRAGACFLKSGVGRVDAFAGAVSARVVETPEAVRALAAGRAPELNFLPPHLPWTARDLAASLAMRAAVNDADADGLRARAAAAEAAGNLSAAAQEMAAAVTLTDAAGDWRALSRLWLEMAGAPLPPGPAEEDGAARERLRADTLSAVVNAYLREAEDGPRADTLVLMAQALEAQGHGRESIPALRLAADLAPGPEVDGLLDRAVEAYGFRVVDHSVDSEAASPRLCVQFSEDLAKGVDYAPYVRVEGRPDLPVEAEGAQLCVEGAEHGQSYNLAVRQGLPAADGQATRRPVEIRAYVRDRSPAVRFVGRAYVLPRGAGAAIPVVTVNTREVELKILRLGERSLVPALRDDLFGQAIGPWIEERIAGRTGQAIWSGTLEVGDADGAGAGGAVNADVTTAILVGEAVGAFEPGLYVMTARVPGQGEAWENAATQWFVVTDLGLAAASGTDGVHVFARALSDASAVAGATVRLLARNNTVLGEVVTDAGGRAHFAPGLARGEGGNAPAAVTVELAGDFAFLDLSTAPFDLSDRGVEGRPAPGPVDVFVSTERGVYRPDEVVHVTALARDGEARAIAGLPLTAVVVRPDGVEYSRAVSSDEGAGGRTWSVRLGGGAPRGTWALRLHADPEAAPVATSAFLVEDFVPERVAFDIEVPGGAVDPLDPPEVSLSVRYLYGAPGAGLPVEGRVELSAADALPGFPGFRFGLEDEHVGTRIATLPAVTTDDEGNAAFVLPLPEVPPVTRPMQLSAIVQVVDGSGRPVERRLTRPLAPTGATIGIRPQFEGAAPEGQAARFELVAAGPQGQVALPTVAWTLSRVDRQWQWYEIDGNWSYEPITRRERVASGTVAMPAAGRAVVEAPVTWGEFELKLASTGAERAAASLTFTAGWHQPAASADTPDVLEIGLDRARYAVGDTVEVRLKPRHAGKLLLAVLDNRLIETQVMDVEAGEAVARLSVTEDWGPGAYITATLIRPMDVAAGRNPSRALGLVWAAVDPGPRELSMQIATPDRVAPRGTFEAAVRIDGAAAGEQAYVTLAAVDLGILNLTGHRPPAPDEYYFGQRRLGVELRDLYGRLIEGMAGTRGRLRQGGDAEMARLKAPPPTGPLVAFFSGVVPVGPDSMARASFDLPDFNGTVRVMAVGWTANAVGHASKDVVVRDPVVVSAAAPRFLAPGDVSRVLVELAHVEGPTGEATVSVETDGGLSVPAEALRQAVRLEEGRIATIVLPVTAVESGEPVLRLRIGTPGGGELAKTITLPVRLKDPEQVRQSRITLDPGGRLVIDAGTFEGLETGTARATLGLGPLALFDVPGLLVGLDRYPYGCTEQLISVAMPLLDLDEVAVALGTRKGDVGERIAGAIAGVLRNQTGGGSFGLWRPDASDLWLDAYATDFLSRAKAGGHAVPDRAFRAALDNLRSQLSYAGDFTDGGEAVAYALMVLAREGMASIGDLRYYADAKAEALATPMAKAQLGAALAFYGEQRRADAMFRVAEAQALGAGPEQRGWRVDYGSQLRDGAAVLALAAEARSAAIDSRRLAGAVSRSALGPTSTQEKAWLLLATRAMIGGAVASVTVDGAPVTGPLVQVIDAAALSAGRVVVANDGGAPVPAVLTTRGVPLDPPLAGGHGYTIDRAYYTLDGELADPGTVAQNTRLAVVLTVSPEGERTGRLIVDDPLPAGFEIDNPNLLRSGSVAALDWLDVEGDVAMAEFRADRFVAAADHAGPRELRLAYIVRAVSPGDFHHPAATVEDMYRPEFRAWSGTGRVEVLSTRP